MTDDTRPIEVVDRLARELLARRSVQEVLDRVVELAAQDIDGASSVSVSLLGKRRRISTVAASDDLALAGDELQYQLGEGPCLDAAWAADAVLCRDLAEESRWPRWRPAATTGLDVRSTLSVRLSAHDRSLGSLNIYSRAGDAFGPPAVVLAGSFATHAAIAYARTIDQQHLEAALASRNLIGQAQGILMERHKITADRAFEVLAAVSQDGNIKLVEVARRLVDTGASPTAREG